ncbi:MAG: hypothetical protein GXY83_04050 [Rhodopirellula sp.]|nr:hypothetical protein [Rhodopirellula sp.]
MQNIPDEFIPESLAYFATAAGFVWNPRDWDAAESCRRSSTSLEPIA